MMKKLFVILLMGVTTFLFAQTIAPKKCNTCGKPLVQCQYKGRHPKTPPEPKQQLAQPSKTVQHSKLTSGYENGHEWVDLGLSVKWATCNVGASSPSDYGGYYAWGESYTKTRYDLKTYFDYLDSTGWGTYKIGGRTRINPAGGHDTAHINWGGKWRMPTDAEIEELCKKCTWTWITMNGIKGCRVTGMNGNSIFLPAAGNRDATDSSSVGEYGNYWSSSLSSYNSCDAIYLGFGSGFHSATNCVIRSVGRSVRPVTE